MLKLARTRDQRDDPTWGESARRSAARRADVRRAKIVRWTTLLALAAAPCRAAADVGPVRITGVVEGYGVGRFDNSSPQQLPQARLDLDAEQKVSPAWRWRIAAIGLWGGPASAGQPGMFDLGHSFQQLSPSLEFTEAYLDRRGETVDLRLGMQKFFWGRLDGVQPNDLLSPRQYEDPFVSDEADRKIAVPALAFTWLFPTAWRSALPDEARFTLVWEPIDVPWRFPLADERWFAPAARSSPRLSVGEAAGTPCPCDIAVNQQLVNSSPPARRFDNGNLGMRMSGRTADTDWALVYFDGYDPTPNFNVPVRVVLGPSAPPGQPQPVTAFTQLKPAYQRFRSLGADAARPFGAFTVRTEAAWRFRRPYPFAVSQITGNIVSNPTLVQRLVAGETIEVPAFVERDAVEWGVGADTIVADFVPLFELYQVILLHNDQALLVRDVDTRLTANLKRRWLADRLDSQLLGVWGIEGGYELVRGQVGYELTEGVQLVGGILGIFGDKNTLVGQYKRNSEVYARVRYTF